MQKENKLGHNNPPQDEAEDVYALSRDIELSDGTKVKTNDQGRIRLTNSLIKKLKRKTKEDKNGDAQYVETIFNDTERVGLKLKINPGGSSSFFFQQWDRLKKYPVKYALGQFPEVKVEVARDLVEKIKRGISVGTDPKSVIEANKLIPTLNKVISEWKDKIMENSKSYRESTREDINNRFRVWLELAPHKSSNKLQNLILSHRSALNLGEKQIHMIEKSDVLAWFKVVSMSGPYQANRIIDDLKIVVKWAMENETWKVKNNFAKLTKEERNPHHKRIDMLDPYTKEEFKRIRKVIMKKHTFRKNGKFPRNYAALMLILMGAFQGRRYRSEIGGVPWSKVDSDRIILDRTKTEDSRSMYELNRQTQWIIRQMKSYCKHKFKETRQIKYKTYVFPSIRKSKVGHCFNIDKTFKTVCAEAKVRRLPVYMLRHTWGSNAVAAGVPLDDIKDSGGWKSWAMVETYAKRDRKRRKKTSQKIATFMATGK
tara:strand:+ start:1424 stop:2875 length:1452 start_codon:yes stop_codon:yes gene_type:complete